MKIVYNPDESIDTVVCIGCTVHIEDMGEGAWAIVIDNEQGNWIFDLTPNGLTLHEAPEGQWTPTAEDLVLAESFGRTVPSWMLWLLIQWDRLKGASRG